MLSEFPELLILHLDLVSSDSKRQKEAKVPVPPAGQWKWELIQFGSQSKILFSRFRMIWYLQPGSSTQLLLMSAEEPDWYWRCFYFVNFTNLEEDVHAAGIFEQNFDALPPDTNNFCKNNSFVTTTTLYFHFQTCDFDQRGFTHGAAHEEQPDNWMWCVCSCGIPDVSPCPGSCSQPTPAGRAVVATEVGPTQLRVQHL